VLQKDRFLRTRGAIVAAGFILLCLQLSLGASAGTNYPYAGRGLSFSNLGVVAGVGAHRYLGMERPDLFAHLRAKQGPGPIPDVQLTPTATLSEEYYSVSAPYGELNRIAISSNGVDEDGDGQFDPDVTADDFNLWLLRVDGSQVTQVTNLVGDELYPAFSPGGRLIAYSSNAGGAWQIYTVEVLTGVVTQITSGPGNKYEPTWSPDSNWLVFSSDASGNRDLYIIPSNGSLAPQQITTNPADETQPMWAPTMGAGGGTPIIFTREGVGGNGSRIFAIGSDGSNETQLSNGGGDPQVNDRDPAWRHNGAMIAFSSDRLTEATDLNRDYNIWTMSSAGESGGLAATLRSNLDPEDAYDDRYPCFNPGLNPREPIRLFFTSWRPDAAGAEPDIWRMEVRDPVPPELVDLPSLQWPRDDRDRYRPPGSEITVYAQAFDRDSGVATVVAEFKDPDCAEDDSQGINHKQYNVFTGDRWFNSGFDGLQYWETDCDTVGNAELFDDGDPAHGDEVAGDGIFTGKWTTPMSPSDFIIDIHVADNAGNQFEYDDVYGLTTQMFEPKTNVLLVDDYCEGQMFPAASGWNNDWPTASPVESYYTTNPGYVPDPSCDNIAYNTIRDGVDGHGFDGEPYDLWRIICRGPITITDLVYYLPTKETQLSVPDLTGTREVLVADRAVVWAAPHTGDTWVASGSLVDATTQATLANFLDRGGRLMISGQDIGFALTMDGTVQNNFYANYLHAAYVNDDNHGVETTINGLAGDPVAQEPWTRGRHYGQWADGGQDTDDYPLEMHMPYDASTASHDGWKDAADAIEWPDGIDALAGAVLCHSYDNGTGAGLHYTDATAGYRVVYYAFDFSSIHREYHTAGNPSTSHCRNYRSKLMHQTLCWLRTGGFQGRVVSISDGGQPITDPTPIVRIQAGSTILAAVQCEEDGRYVIGGVPPDYYTISAVRPGFEIDHYDGQFCHGGLNYRVIDFAIARAEPGAVRGTVVSAATGDPLATVEVCAYTVLPPDPDNPDVDPGLGELIGCTTTAADGTYTIGDIPPGDIDVIADGSNIGYGSETQRTTITSGNTNTVDFALEAAPGIIVATVTDANGVAIPDALVEVMYEGNALASGATDENGQVSIEVAPGDYLVQAEASGYERSAGQAVSVEAAQQVEITIALQSQPPGSLSGLVTRAVSGEAVAGVVVDVLSITGETVLATATTTDTVTDPPGPAKPYNYRFDNVPTGQVVVKPNPIGFSASPTQQIVRVDSGVETDGVNFQLSSIRTFPAGLQMVSLPYDYPADDPADLLGEAAESFQMAAYEPNDGRYHLYPGAPADKFRLGYGYWLKLDNTRELGREGTEAGDVFELGLHKGASGWNIVGDFFSQIVDFYALHVRDQNGVVRTMQEAMAAGLVRSPLFTYVLGGYQTSSVLEPYAGYWLKVGDDITLIGNRSTDTLAVGERASRPAVAAPEDGWLLPLVVSAGQLRDNSTWIGCAASASDSFDVGVDVAKPPRPEMGPSVYAAIEHDDWGGANGRYAVDVRSAASQRTTWKLAISCAGGQDTVTVGWPDMSRLPADVRPVLRDPATGRQVYMRTAQGYEFSLRGGRRVLEIELTNSADLPLVVSSLMAGGAGGALEISYTLSSDAEVSVEVRNMAGRLVQTVLAGALQATGIQSVGWNGMSKTGSRAPNGRYVVVVRARTASGQQAQAIGSLLLRR